MRNLSYKEAAAEVLRKSKIPLTSKEILKQAASEKLIRPRGKTPEATLAAMLYVDIRDNPESFFLKAGPGVFAFRPAKNSARS